MLQHLKGGSGEDIMTSSVSLTCLSIILQQLFRGRGGEGREEERGEREGRQPATRLTD